MQKKTKMGNCLATTNNRHQQQPQHVHRERQWSDRGVPANNRSVVIQSMVSKSFLSSLCITHVQKLLTLHCSSGRHVLVAVYSNNHLMKRMSMQRVSLHKMEIIEEHWQNTRHRHMNTCMKLSTWVSVAIVLTIIMERRIIKVERLD